MKSKESQLPETYAAASNPAENAVQGEKRPGKLFVIISYALVLAALIAALFVPIYKGEMLIKYLLAAVNEFLHTFKLEIENFPAFFINEPLINYEWILILAYCISLLLSLIMLIPVIIGKPYKETNLKCAFAAEFIAFFIVLAFAACELYLYVGEWQNYATLIPLGVTFIVMAAQSIKYKGWLGVFKLVTALLALVTLFTLFDIANVIPALHEPLLSLSGSVGAYDADVTFMNAYPNGISGLYEIILLYQGTGYFTETAGTADLVSRILFSVISIFIVLSVFTDLLWLVVGRKSRQRTDGEKLSGEPLIHEGWFTFALIRYIVIILLIVAAVLFGLFLEGFWKVGIYSYLTAIIIFCALIVEIVRYCVARAKRKAYREAERRRFNAETLRIDDPALDYVEPEEAKEEEQQPEEAVQLNYLGEPEVVESEPVEEPAPEEPAEDNGEQLTITEIETVEEQPAEEPAEPEPVEEPAPVESAPAQQPAAPVPPVTPFAAESQPEEEETTGEKLHIDPFVDKLNNRERAEFFDIFVNRNRGKIGSIPAYELNGNNSEFFPLVFVHINRTRDLCSDSLLTKIYNEIGRN